MPGLPWPRLEVQSFASGTGGRNGDPRPVWPSGDRALNAAAQGGRDGVTAEAGGSTMHIETTIGMSEFGLGRSYPAGMTRCSRSARTWLP